MLGILSDSHQLGTMVLVRKHINLPTLNMRVCYHSAWSQTTCIESTTNQQSPIRFYPSFWQALLFRCGDRDVKFIASNRLLRQLLVRDHIVRRSNGIVDIGSETN